MIYLPLLYKTKTPTNIKTPNDNCRGVKGSFSTMNAVKAPKRELRANIDPVLVEPIFLSE